MMKKSKTKYIVLILIAIITTCFLGLALFLSDDSEVTSEMPLVNTETVYIIFGLMVLLFLFLMFLLYVSIRRFFILKKMTVGYDDGDTDAPSIVIGHSNSNDDTSRSSRKAKQNDGLSRFYMLSKIDDLAMEYKKPKYNNDFTLKELCDDFRDFACSELKLYYDISDIRQFIAALSVTHIIILQGMSGTGKTSLAYAFGEFLKNSTVVVPIQPMWKERTDLIGYFNEFTKKFNETLLLQKLYEANYNDEIYITVLDELNIARVEYYFAEFLSLLELPDVEKRYIDVVSDEWKTDPKLLKNGRLRLPKNMWFVGTANNDDSTFAISDKVYDRAMVLNLDKKAKPFEVASKPVKKISASRLEQIFKKSKKEYGLTSRNLRRIRELDKYLIQNYHISFGNRIMKQMKEYVPVYVACGGTELEAIDNILAKKVLRKLESKNLVYVRNTADSLCTFIDELFGDDKMVMCKEYIKNFEQNA